MTRRAGREQRSEGAFYAGLGAVAAALSQAGVVVAIARLAGPEELGRYAVAVAIVTPIILLARMQLRTVVASEPDRPRSYLAFALTRLAASATGAALSIAAGAALVDTPSFALITWLALARIPEGQGELIWGFLQRRGRWRAIALSQALHGLGSMLVVALVLLWGFSLEQALAGSTVAQLAVLVSVDLPLLGGTFGSRRPGLGREIGQIFAECALLAPAGALVSLNGHLPRLALERWASLEAVGTFAALAQLTLGGNLVIQALGQASLTPMARQAQESPPAFRRSLRRLTLLALGVGFGGTVLTSLAGALVLELLYGDAIAEAATGLTALMTAATFLYLAGVWGYALAALGERRLQLPIYLAATASGALSAWIFIPVTGLMGGVAAYAVAWAVAAFGCLWGIVRRQALARAGITEAHSGRHSTEGELAGPEVQA